MRVYTAVFLLVVLVGFSVPADAALIDRGTGMIYDTELGITWLQDANYAQTSGYDSDGLMNWDDAMIWANQLAYGGYSDWRLPKVDPVDGESYNNTQTYDGSTDRSYNISAPNSVYPYTHASEMAYMYYNNLNNTGRYDIYGNENHSGTYGLLNSGLF
jgi:hypothetical protein